MHGSKKFVTTTEGAFEHEEPAFTGNVHNFFWATAMAGLVRHHALRYRTSLATPVASVVAVPDSSDTAVKTHSNVSIKGPFRLRAISSTTGCPIKMQNGLCPCSKTQLWFRLLLSCG